MKPINAYLEYIFPAVRNPSTSTYPKRLISFKKNVLSKHSGSDGLKAFGSNILNQKGFDLDFIESAQANTFKNEV